MKLITLIAVLLLSACSNIPSFYDDNASRLAVDVRYAVRTLNCEKPNMSLINEQITMLDLYTESKGSKDVNKMVRLMKETSDAMSEKENMSKPYCGLKKRILEEQSKKIATAIMGRF